MRGVARLLIGSALKVVRAAKVVAARWEATRVPLCPYCGRSHGYEVRTRGGGHS